MASAANVGTEVVVSSVPATPSGLTASSASPSQVSLSWSDNSSNESGFEIERKTGVLGSYAVIASTTVNIALYTDNSVSASTEYYYRVRAFNVDGYSSYSNEASVTTLASPSPPASPSPASPGSGGGGGGTGFYSPPTPQTSLTFQGISYPGSLVTILWNGQMVATTSVAASGIFEVSRETFPGGTFNFTVWASDRDGFYSLPQSFSIVVATGASTIVRDIILAPTLHADRPTMKPGESVTFSGFSQRGAVVELIVSGAMSRTLSVSSTADGSWSITLPTDRRATGSLFAQARSVLDGKSSPYSYPAVVRLSEQTTVEPPTTGGGCVRFADVNKDCRVNLVDFSILAYWYQRELRDDVRYVDLNKDGSVTLVDFSIMAYYWTG